MEFMVSVRFRPEDREALVAHIPQEQARINALREQGIVEAFYIASDFTHIWLVMQGESQAQVQKQLETLPLYPYMEPEWALLSKM